MNNIKNLSDQLQRAYSGEAWHGPSLREILTDVTSPIASAKPIAAGHSIWELVMHIGAWVSAVRRRLAGQPVALSPQEDWPAIDGGSETAWQHTLAALEDEHNKLREAISALPEESLLLTVAGERYSVFFMLQGVIQHNLYHAGQIVLLKKALSA